MRRDEKNGTPVEKDPILEALHEYNPIIPMLSASYPCFAVLISRKDSSVAVMVGVGEKDGRIGGESVK